MNKYTKYLISIALIMTLASCSLSTKPEFTSDSSQESIYSEVKYPQNSIPLYAPLESNDFKEHRIYYATNRRSSVRIGRFFGKHRGILSFGVLYISVPKQRRVGTIKVSKKRNPNLTKYFSIRDRIIIERDQFLKQMGNSEDNILIYIHGYRNSFTDAAYRTAQIKEDLSFKGEAILLSWPSQNEVEKYMVDETNEKWSVPIFSGLLTELSTSKKKGNIYIIAHSMGTRFIASMIKEIKCRGNDINIKDIILAAPDIDADIFKNDIAPLLPTVSSRVTVYTSQSDKALFLSKKIHGNIRAGQYAEVVANKHIETIDATGIDTSFLGINHAYYSESKELLMDIKHIFSESPISQRNIFKKGNYWKFK